MNPSEVKVGAMTLGGALVLALIVSFLGAFSIFDRGYNLEISQLETGNTNTFYVYGGKDESSQDLIQGKTLAGILFDEAPLMPMSFINCCDAGKFLAYLCDKNLRVQ